MDPVLPKIPKTVKMLITNVTDSLELGPINLALMTNLNFLLNNVKNVSKMNLKELLGKAVPMMKPNTVKKLLINAINSSGKDIIDNVLVKNMIN